MHTGTKIKELRKQRKMTQEELGELLGVKKAAIQKYEKGEIINLKVATIKRLCEIFEISSNELIFPEAAEFDRNSKHLPFEVKIIESVESAFGPPATEILSAFMLLNDDGQKRLLDAAHDLLLIDKYVKNST